MFDRFTEGARRSMSSAREAALRWRHDYIGTEHMLVGVLVQDPDTLRALGVEPAAVRVEVDRIVRPGTCDSVGQLPFTPRGKRVLEISLDEATRLGHATIEPRHLLLGLVLEREGYAAHVLRGLGVTPARVRVEVFGAPVEARDLDPLTPNQRARVRATNLLLVGGAFLGVVGLVGEWLAPPAGRLGLFTGAALVVLGLVRRAAASARARLRGTQLR